MNQTWWVGDDLLDNDQKAIIELPIEGKFLIKGPPGSGKTNLLLLRSNYLIRGGFPNIIILVFSRTLQEFIRTGGNHYDFHNEKILTNIKWMTDLLYSYGRTVNNSGLNFEQLRNLLVSEVRDLIREKNLKHIYEVILIDEAQDCLEEELQIINTLAKYIFAVADSRQKIFPGESALNFLSTIVDRSLTLRYHYRNGIKICKLADGIADKQNDYIYLANTSNYKENLNPSKVEAFKCNDLEIQLQLLLTNIKLQLDTYPEEFIGVACPRNEEMSVVKEFLSSSDVNEYLQFQSSIDGYLPFTNNKRVILCTVHNAKGLEFRALNLVTFEYIKRFQFQRNLSYTAVTRAKTSLNIFHSNNLPGYLEQAYESILPPKPTPIIKELFGKSKK